MVFLNRLCYKELMGEIITVSPQRRLLAQIMADEIAQFYNRSRDLGWDRPDGKAFYIAYLFEQALVTYFKDKAIRYEPVIGGPDNGDLQLTMTAGFEVTADAKCAGGPGRSCIMMPLKSARHHLYPLYIGGRFLDDERVEIMGYAHADDWCANDEYRQVPERAPSVWLMFDAMLDIEFLALRLAPGRAAEKYPEFVMKRYRAELAAVA